jgi:ribonuclease HI
MFSRWMREGHVPDCLNTALIKLLPKTENGLDDLNKVRPIALMESIIKLFERVLIGRVTKVLVEYDILEEGQYGGLPGLGVQPPLRMLAEVIDDAHASKQELHILITDLSKAFDTMEYWSQAMSWKALNMPDEIINLLVSLDKGTPETGQGATSRVSLAQGRTTKTFQHGRGVRQGSVGGPIKWCVFVNSWIRWVKIKMKNKGYKMAESRATPKLADFMNREASIKHTVEMIGNMFIDDATWTTGDKPAMQELIGMCETFCDFHGVDLHRTKSECFSTNVRPSDTDPLLWEDTEVIDGKTVRREVPTHSTEIKSLGVYFDSDGSWKSQIKVSAAKLDTLLLKIRNTSAATPIVKYGINVKVIPTIAYPLQVAAIPQTELSKWDGKIREAYRAATNTAVSTPIPMYYMDPENLGFGIRSLEDIAQGQAVRNLLTGLNSTNNASGEASELADIVRAGHARHQRGNPSTKPEDRGPENPKIYRRSQNAHAEAAAKALGLKVEENQHNKTIEHVFHKDRIHMEACPRSDPVRVFTDGSTLDAPTAEGHRGCHNPECTAEQSTVGPRNKPKMAGWGWVSEPSDGWDQLQNEHSWNQESGQGSTMSARLLGDQDNFTAETAALLSVLREHHKTTDLQIFIDNDSVVSRFEKDTRKSAKLRLATPARAMWNRIMAIMQLREGNSETQVQWVHSHVDENKVKNKRQCACKTDTVWWWGQHPLPGGKEAICDKEHFAHEGNEKADSAAKQGAQMAANEHSFDVLDGDEAYILLSTITGRYCQGQVKAFVDEATRSKRIRECTQSERRTIKQLGQALELSSVPMRKRLSQIEGVPSTFPGRALTESLPTHKREAQRVAAESDQRDEHGMQKLGQYTRRFGHKLKGGLCQRCLQQGYEVLETVEHILAQCDNPEATKIRSKALADITSKWEDTFQAPINGKVQWGLIDPTGHTNPCKPCTDGWQAWWGWVGLMPATVDSTKGIERKAVAFAVDKLAKAGVDLWAARNDWVQEWYKEEGIPSAHAASRHDRHQRRMQDKRRGTKEDRQKAEAALKSQKEEAEKQANSKERIRKMADFFVSRTTAPVEDEDEEEKTTDRKATVRCRECSPEQPPKHRKPLGSQAVTRATGATKMAAAIRRRLAKLGVEDGINENCSTKGCNDPAVGRAPICNSTPQCPRCQEHLGLTCQDAGATKLA